MQVHKRWWGNLSRLGAFKKEEPRFFQWIMIIAIVNAFFIWFPSFDHQNIAFWINSASYLQNAVPSFSGSPWVGGPFFLSLFVPLGTAYSFSGYDELVSVTVLKLILFTFTLLTAFLLYSMIKRFNPRFAQIAFVFTMLNPGIIYVNYFWTELDIFPVFFVALSYYFLFYFDKRKISFISTLGSLVPLFIAIFSFYYAILIIPAIIVYSRNRRERLFVLVSSLFLGISLYLVEIFMFRGGNFNLVGSLVPSSTNLYFQGLQRIVLIPPFYLILSIGSASVIIPVLMRKYGFPPSVPIFFVLMLLLFTSNNSTPNNFLWLYPFSVLAVTELVKEKPKLRSIILTSSFFWTGIIFINLYIGTGFQAGIFYFAYNVFHANILFITTESQWIFSTLIYFAFLTASFAGTVIYISYFVRRGQKDWTVAKQPKSTADDQAGLTTRKKQRETFFFAVVLVLLLIAFALFFNSVMPVSLNNAPVREAPVDSLLSQFTNGVVAFPVEDNTYQISGNTVSFYDNGNVIWMTRNLSAEYIGLTMSQHLNLQPGLGIMLLNTSAFQVSEYDSFYANISSSEIISPIITNAGNYSTVSVPTVSGRFDVADFNTDTGAVYNSGNFSSFNYYFLLYKIQHAISPASSFNQTVLFGIYNGNVAVNFVVYNNSGILSYNDGNFHANIPVYDSNDTPDGWNLLTLQSTGNQLIIGINGINTILKGAFFDNESRLYIGMGPGNDTSHSFTGLVSELYSSNAIGISNEIYNVVTYGNSKTVFDNHGSTVNLMIADSSSGTILTVGAHYFFFGAPISYLKLGKLDPVPYGLSITFISLHIMPRNNDGYYMVPVFFAFIVPYIVAALGIAIVYKSGNGKK